MALQKDISYLEREGGKEGGKEGEVGVEDGSRKKAFE
jgi:hypothetical protein